MTSSFPSEKTGHTRYRDRKESQNYGFNKKAKTAPYISINRAHNGTSGLDLSPPVTCLGENTLLTTAYNAILPPSVPTQGRSLDTFVLKDQILCNGIHQLHETGRKFVAPIASEVVCSFDRPSVSTQHNPVGVLGSAYKDTSVESYILHLCTGTSLVTVSGDGAHARRRSRHEKLH